MYKVKSIRQDLTMPTCTPVMGSRNLKDASPFMLPKPLFVEENKEAKMLSGQCPKTPTISKYCEANVKVKEGLNFLNKYAHPKQQEEVKVGKLENYHPDDMDEKISINGRGPSFNNSKNTFIAKKGESLHTNATPKAITNEKKETKQFDFRTYLQQIDKKKESPFPVVGSTQYKDKNVIEILLGKKLNVS